MYHQYNNNKKNLKQETSEPGVVAQACNLSTQEAETGGSQIQGQPGLPGLQSKNETKKNDMYVSGGGHLGVEREGVGEV
jgi:hypothetical protein